MKILPARWGYLVEIQWRSKGLNPITLTWLFSENWKMVCHWTKTLGPLWGSKNSGKTSTASLERDILLLQQEKTKIN